MRTIFRTARQALVAVVVVSVAAPWALAADGPLCREAVAPMTPQQWLPTAPLPASVLEHVVQPAAEEVARPSTERTGSFRYEVGESLSWALSYNRTFLFETASTTEVRNHKFANFSNDRERDVFGLGLDWRVGESIVGLGYQLQSTRPPRPVDTSVSTSILPRSIAVGHAFTLGLTRRWGARD